MSLSSFLRTPELADRLGISASKLNKLRCTGDGPPFVKFGRDVLYDTEAVDAWLKAQQRASTSERAA